MNYNERNYMLMCVVSHAFMQHWESVSTSEKRESSDRKLLYNYVLFLCSHNGGVCI